MTTWVLLHEDSFNRADGTLDGSTMSDGLGVWSTPPGAESWNVDTNQASPSAVSEEGIIDQEMSAVGVQRVAANCSLAFTVGLLARHDSYAGGQARAYLAHFGGGGFVTLYSLDNGGYTSLVGSMSGTLNPMELWCEGTTISVYDGVTLMGSTTDSTWTTGKAGMFSSNAGRQLDNFKVYVEETVIGGYILQEDGASRIQKEDGSGFLIQENTPLPFPVAVLRWTRAVAPSEANDPIRTQSSDWRWSTTPAAPTFPFAVLQQRRASEVRPEDPLRNAAQDWRWSITAVPSFPAALLRAPAVRRDDESETLPRDRRNLDWRSSATHPLAWMPSARQRSATQPDDVVPRQRTNIDWLWSVTPAAPFPFVALQQPRLREAEPDTSQRLRAGLDWLFTAAPASPAFPLAILRQQRQMEALVESPQLRPSLDWAWPPPAAAPAFPMSVLRQRRASEVVEDPVRRSVPIDWQWPAPTTPTSDWATWMLSPRQPVPEPIFEPQLWFATSRLRLHDWYPGQDSEQLSIVVAGLWSIPVDLLAGEEYRITIDGPSASNPKVRVSIKLE